MTASSDDKMCKLTCESFSCGKRMFRVKTIKVRKASFVSLIMLSVLVTCAITLIVKKGN